MYFYIIYIHRLSSININTIALMKTQCWFVLEDTRCCLIRQLRNAVQTGFVQNGSHSVKPINIDPTLLGTA